MADLVMGAPATTGDDQQLTTTMLFEHAARSFGAQEVVYRDQGGHWRTTDYAHTWRRIRGVAAGLQAHGVGPGDRVGLLLWNDIRHFESYFAIPAVGATMVQLNLRLSPAELGYIIGHSGVTRIVVDETLLPLAEAIAPHIADVELWILASDDLSEVSVPESLSQTVAYEDLAATDAGELTLPTIDERTASGACYTTGTTGRPKGVFYSHRSTWLHAQSIAMNITMSDQDTVMFLTPMFHVQCWGLPYAAVATASRVVLPGRFTMQDTALLVDAFVEHEVTVAPAAPAILSPMLHYLEQLEEAPNLRHTRLICGASEPSLAMMRGIYDLTGAQVLHAYGATETSPIVSVNRLIPPLEQQLDDDAAWDLRRSQGVPVIGVDLKIADPAGKSLPHDGRSVGEICVRGPWITRSYHDNPEANRSAFDEEGYWRSGDVGSVDENGFLKITDRLKDVIKSGGEWISSIDMENHLAGMEQIAEVAVFGVPHPKWEERPLVLIVPAQGRSVTLDDVRQELAGRFADWQLPDKVEIVDEILRTSVGKINKRSLRDQYSGVYDVDPNT